MGSGATNDLSGSMHSGFVKVKHLQSIQRCMAEFMVRCNVQCLCTEFTVATGKCANTREACCWAHVCKSCKRVEAVQHPIAPSSATP
jgi:hypothetical protein